MKNTDQNYTDNFFKQGLSTPPEFSPSEENWEELQRLLKKRERGRVIPWALALSGAAAAILLLMLFWITPDTNIADKEQGQKAAITKVEKKDSQARTSNSDSAIPTENVNRTVNEQAKIRSSTEGVKGNVNQGFYSKLAGITNEPSFKDDVARGTIKADFTTIRDARLLSLQPTIPNQIANEAVNNIQDLSSKKPAAAVSGQQEKISAKDAGRWALSMAFSPDVNSVNNMGKGELGHSMGLGMSFNIKPSFSLSTGIYYSKKQYSADKTSYNVTEKPFATWASYSNKIDADCRVIDIPLNLNFRISKKSNNKLYASAGMSSYIMLSEKYEFVYNPSPAYPTGRREYTVRDENKHILNVVNLGVALEKPISEQVSLVIQPYAKLPLTGIGKGRTDLKSVGIGFGLNYSLKRK